MSRPRNAHNEEHIATTAFRLFMQQGYNKTTYKDIAEASGNERTNIQYYFPKKDLLIIDFLNRLLNYSTEFIEVKFTALEDPFVKLYAIGQVYFSFLLYNPKLTLEIISDRSITEKILFLNEDWTYAFLNTDPAHKSEELTEDIVMSLGGAYEVMYRNIVSGGSVHVPRLLKKVMISFMAGLGYERSTSDKLLSAYVISGEVFTEANAHLEQVLLNEAE